MAKIKIDMFMRPQGPARALRRHEARETFKVMNAKEEAYSASQYGQAQSPYSAFYAGIDPRRKWEMAAGGMAEEDQKAMSNLSPNGYQKEYPAAGYYTTPYLDEAVEAPVSYHEEDGSFYNRPKGRR
jgi:hypothetical protein